MLLRLFSLCFTTFSLFCLCLCFFVLFSTFCVFLSISLGFLFCLLLCWKLKSKVSYCCYEQNKSIIQSFKVTWIYKNIVHIILYSNTVCVNAKSLQFACPLYFYIRCFTLHITYHDYVQNHISFKSPFIAMTCNAKRSIHLSFWISSLWFWLGYLSSSWGPVR